MEKKQLRLNASSIIKEALASAAPGEDFDEALLRVLKAQYPQEAAALLSAYTRLIEFESQRTGETREQTLRRLAESELGPEIVFSASDRQPSTVVTQTTVTRKYKSLDEVPPEIRQMIDKGPHVERKFTPKVGCSFSLLAWLFVLLGLRGR